MRQALARSRPRWLRILQLFSNAWVRFVAGGTLDFGFDHQSLPLAIGDTARQCGRLDIKR